MYNGIYGNILTGELSFQNRMTVHWILQTSALTFITIAQICIFVDKINQGKHHYQTAHSLFGVTTYLFTVLSCISGILTKFKKSSFLAKTLHLFSGLITYLLAMVTICLGISQSWDSSYDSYTNAIIYIILAFTALFLSMKGFMLLWVYILCAMLDDIE